MPDMNLPEFIAHLVHSIVHLDHAEHTAMERACKVIEKEAKRELGTYQGQAGPFVAWADLADSTIAEKEKLGFAPPDNPLLRTGDLRDSIDHAVGVREGAVGSDSPIAEYQELGTSRGIPPRSFLGGAAVRKGPEVAEIIGLSPVMALVGEEVVNRRLVISNETAD